MKIHLPIDTVAARAQLRRWGGEYREKVKTAVERALTTEAALLKQEVRAHVASQMTVVRKSFVSAFRAKVINDDKTRLPALYVGAKMPWAQIHETGGSITGRLLIPLHGRPGRKRFKAQITELMRGGNAYFVKNAKGNLVLMAENIAEHRHALAGFKRRYRKAAGIKRIKRGADIPIAVLVRNVRIKKRLDIERLVNARLPRLAAAVDRRLNALD